MVRLSGIRLGNLLVYGGGRIAFCLPRHPLKRRQRYHLRRLHVHEIVDAALASAAGLIEAGNFTVERDIQPHLPDVMGDASALSQCLQNLITNALKYGQEQRWLGIRAAMSEAGDEVEIGVFDRQHGHQLGGLAPHIFEPFYRAAPL